MQRSFVVFVSLSPQACHPPWQTWTGHIHRLPHGRCLLPSDWSQDASCARGSAFPVPDNRCVCLCESCLAGLADACGDPSAWLAGDLRVSPECDMTSALVGDKGWTLAPFTVVLSPYQKYDVSVVSVMFWWRYELGNALNPNFLIIRLIRVNTLILQNLFIKGQYAGESYTWQHFSSFYFSHEIMILIRNKF